MVGFLGIFGPKLGARAETIDVQVLGAPASLLVRRFVPSGFATPATQAFLTQIGDQSIFEFIWANDTGCTRHIVKTGEDRVSRTTSQSASMWTKRGFA